MKTLSLATCALALTLLLLSVVSQTLGQTAGMSTEAGNGNQAALADAGALDRFPENETHSDGPADGEEEEAPHDPVHSLTGDTFDDFLGAHEATLVKFVAPWCPHCRKFNPEFNKAASHCLKTLHGDVGGTLSSQLAFATVDATLERGLAERFSVEGFPTTLLLRRDSQSLEPEVYTAARNARSIVDWLRVRGLLRVPYGMKHVISDDGVDEARAAHSAFMFGFFKSESSSAFRAFSTASQHQEVPYLYTLAAPIAAAVGVTKAPGIVMVRRAETVPFKGLVTANAIDSFAIHSRWNEGIIAMNGENHGRVLDRAIMPRKLFLFTLQADIADENAQEVNDFSDQVQRAFADAQRADSAHSTRYVLVRILRSMPTADRTAAMRAAMLFNIHKTADFPLLGFISEEQSNFTRRCRNSLQQNEPVAADTITAFMHGCTRGEEPQLRLSQPAPTKPTAPGAPIVLVGTTYFDQVLNLERESAFQDKFALLYLYSRHCLLCMDVPYNAVASALQDEQDVVVASIDGLRNEIELPVPDTGVFPRMLLLDPSRTVAQELTVPLGRAWTVDEIVAFVQKHLPSSSTEL